MMNAVKRFSAVRSCRVGLSFGTGDSNLLVCGLLYIPGSLSFFPSEKSPPRRLFLRRHEAFIPSAWTARCCNRPVSLSGCLPGRQG